MTEKYSNISKCEESIKNEFSSEFSHLRGGVLFKIYTDMNIHINTNIELHRYQVQEVY